MGHLVAEIELPDAPKKPIWPIVVGGWCFITALACSFYVFIYGPQFPQTPLKDKFTFERVMFVNWTTYIIFSEDENKDVQINYIRGSGTNYYNVSIRADVPQGESMWLEEYKEAAWPHRKSARIHIHSLKNIEGAEWKYGRGGSSVNIPIE